MLTFFFMEALIEKTSVYLLTWDDLKKCSKYLCRMTEILLGSIGKREQNIYLLNRRFCFSVLSPHDHISF